MNDTQNCGFATQSERAGRSCARVAAPLFALAATVLIILFLGLPPTSAPISLSRNSGVQETSVDVSPVIADANEILIHDFQVSNLAERACKIVSLSTSCSCSSGEIDKRLLLPGETALLRLTSRLSDRKGDLSLSCRLRLDTGAERVYSVNTIVYRRLEIIPSEIVVGRIDIGSLRSYEVSAVAHASASNGQHIDLSVASLEEGGEHIDIVPLWQRTTRVPGDIVRVERKVSNRHRGIGGRRATSSEVAGRFHSAF